MTRRIPLALECPARIWSDLTGKRVAARRIAESAMSSAFKIYALFIGSALLMFGGGLQGLLLSVRGAEEHFSLTALGLIGTGWSVGFVAGSITVPLLVKRVGHIRAYSIMAAIGTVTILLNLLWIQDIGWIVLRAASGYCFAGA